MTVSNFLDFLDLFSEHLLLRFDRVQAPVDAAGQAVELLLWEPPFFSSKFDVSDKSFLSLVFAQVNEKSEVMSIFLLTFVGRNYRLNHILKQELRLL